jgi:transposase-like protein
MESTYPIEKIRVIKKWSAAEKLAFCKSWKQSGLSRSAYCRREGLSLPTLCTWLKRQTSEKKPPAAVKFIGAAPVPAIQPLEEQSLEVKLTNGLQCRFSRVVSIKQICQVIEGLQHVTTD